MADHLTNCSAGQLLTGECFISDTPMGVLSSLCGLRHYYNRPFIVLFDQVFRWRWQVCPHLPKP